jgi:hypothetical protein
MEVLSKKKSHGSLYEKNLFIKEEVLEYKESTP